MDSALRWLMENGEGRSELGQMLTDRQQNTNMIPISTRVPTMGTPTPRPVREPAYTYNPSARPYNPGPTPTATPTPAPIPRFPRQDTGLPPAQAVLALLIAAMQRR